MKSFPKKGTNNPRPFPEKLYTIQELAAEWEISTRTVHRFITDGRLSHYRFGNRIKFSTVYIQEFLEKNEYKAL